MKQWTTWEILKDGQPGERFEAISAGLQNKVVVEVDESGSIKYAEGDANESRIGSFISINVGTRDLKWTKATKYITFDEAKELLLDGKKVKIHYKNGTHDIVYLNDRLEDFCDVTIDELFTLKYSPVEG